jgi:carboxylate-amine ligase
LFSSISRLGTRDRCSPESYSREYVPHLLALSVNSPFWQGEVTDMQSSRVLIFSRSIHRAGLPEVLGSWDAYTNYVDYLERSGTIHKLAEIWWDVRPHPELSTVELRACDTQTDPWRSEALVALTSALCESVSREYDSGERRSLVPSREIEENKWSAQRFGLRGAFLDHESHESTPTLDVLHGWLEDLEEGTERDLSGAARILSEPTESERQLEVYRETGSTAEVARDVAARTRASTDAWAAASPSPS